MLQLNSKGPVQPTAKLPAAAYWVLASVLITDIGNGMHTITIGKLLYDRTGSVAAFGSVIIAEYILNFLLQTLAGSMVDRGSPKAICVWADIVRGIFISRQRIFGNSRLGLEDRPAQRAGRDAPEKVTGEIM